MRHETVGSEVEKVGRDPVLGHASDEFRSQRLDDSVPCNGAKYLNSSVPIFRILSQPLIKMSKLTEI